MSARDFDLTTGEFGRVARSAHTEILVDGEAYYRAFHRAAERARRYVLLSGWQFDSEVRLIRGGDAARASGPVELLPMLDGLCHARPDLRVYILAWDYSLVFAAERELAQSFIFRYTTSDRVVFCFDGAHPVGASHHQKFAVVDGQIAFAGGLDLCASRWDRRAHELDDPERTNTRGVSYDPFHDVQVGLSGKAAAALAELFRDRWRVATGDELVLPDVSLRTPDEPATPDASATTARTVVLGTTRAPHPGVEASDEVMRLLVQAILTARELIYIETQYFTSHALTRALRERMSDSAPVSIVMVLPREAAGAEQLALGAAQMEAFGALAEASRARAQSFGVFYSAGKHGGREVQTYVHAKLMIVDDRLVSIGSANCTNRSMSLDTELNVSWREPDVERLRRLRAGLLAEHAGLEDPSRFAEPEGLVERLVMLAESETSKLHVHPDVAGSRPPPALSASGLFDPERPITEIEFGDVLDAAGLGGFARGITLLDDWLRGPTEEKDGDET